MNNPKPNPSGKIHGKVSWPISVKLPHNINMVGGPEQPFRTPSSFIDSDSVYAVAYDLQVKISRKGLLKSNASYVYKPDLVVYISRRIYRFQTKFDYITLDKPSEAPSTLRQLAYQEGCPLQGPDADPLGWKGFSVDLDGKLFESRSLVGKATVRVSFMFIPPH